MNHTNSHQKSDNNCESVYLDDGELDDLVAELSAELSGHRDRGPSAHDQFDQLARDLESDFVTQSERYHPPQSQEKTNGLLFNAPSAGLSAAAQSMGFGAPAGMIHSSRPVNIGLNNATNSLSFAPPISTSRARAFSSRDEFDEGMNSRDANVWRHVVSNDVAAMRLSNNCNSLSRAYRFDTSIVPTLDDHFAMSIAVESARNAARAACLSEDATQQLLHVAAESGSAYLHELEIAISSRLGADNEFDRERFPNAYRRFISL